MSVSSPSGGLGRGLWGRFAVLGACWGVLTWSDGWASLVVGIPAILAGGLVSRRLGSFPRCRVDIGQLLRFLALFVGRSLAGGWDVARRALSPRMSVAPRMIAFRTRLPAGLPRLVFAHSISLIPGSLLAGLDGDLLSVHLLDGSAEASGELRVMEHDVARAFSISLQEEPHA